MTGDWQWVTLECPVCRRPVEVCIDELLARQRQCCSEGHSLPAVDLGESGLREALDLIGVMLGSVERMRPVVSPG